MGRGVSRVQYTILYTLLISQEKLIFVQIELLIHNNIKQDKINVIKESIHEFMKKTLFEQRHNCNTLH